MKRRNFILNSTGALFSISSLAQSRSLPYLNQIGIQLYTLRKPISADLGGTIKEVANAGYKQVEPYGFPSPQAVEMINKAKENGMQVHSSHFDWNAVLHPERKGIPSFNKILELANELELSHLVVPYLAETDRRNIDGYKKVADLLNQAAEKADDAKIQLAYHNHAFEFQPLDKKKIGYDVFIENFSTKMAFELDVFWVKLGGVDPATLIKQLKGRVSQLHLKDLKKKSKVPNFGKVSPDTFDEIGDGMINMEPIMKVAQQTGVQHCHIEQDQSPAPLKSIRKSLNYLKSK